MSWNHRVVRRHSGPPINADWLQISEVYYRGGKPEHFTESAIGVTGDTVEELQQTLTWMQKALTEPILDEADFDEK